MKKVDGVLVRELYTKASIEVGENPLEYAFLNNDSVRNAILWELDKFDSVFSKAILTEDEDVEMFELFGNIEYSLEFFKDFSEQELEGYYMLVFQAFANVMNKNPNLFNLYQEDLKQH